MGATAAAEGGLSVPVAALAQTAGATGLRYSDGSAASRTVIVLQGNAAALQHRLPVWSTADTPNLPLYSAADPSIVCCYQEDQVFNIARSEP